MKLRRFQIDRFKALDELSVGIPRNLLFLIGMNGAGKSSVLQALSFVRAFVEGDVMPFFADRGWEPADIRPRINLRTINVGGGRSARIPANVPVTIRLLLESEDGASLVWEFAWSPTQQGSNWERV